jgi:hypothetical protein
MGTTQPSRNTPDISRRQLLQGAALAGLGALGRPAVVRSRAPSDKLNIAIIGCGGRRGADARADASKSTGIIATDLIATRAQP